MLDISEESSVKYLENHIRKLEKTGLVVQGEVERGDPVEWILKTSVEKKMDLICWQPTARQVWKLFSRQRGFESHHRFHHNTLLLIPV